MANIEKAKAKLVERIHMLESELRESLTKKDSSTVEISISDYLRKINDVKAQLNELLKK